MNPAQIINRIHHERPDWRPPGIHAAVSKALHDYPPELVLRAGLAAAADRSARTPAVIPTRCQHEQELIAAGQRTPLAADRARSHTMPLPAEHCQRPGCPCSHSGGCDAGWLAMPGGSAGREEDRYRPCPTCRPGLTERCGEAADWRAQRDRRRAELAATRNDAARQRLLDETRAQLAARRTSRTTTTTTTQEGMTA